MLESDFQAKLIRKMRRMFPGAIILRNDANYMQGVPDLTILYGARWAALEVKASADARERPNQRYYVDKWNEMSFAAFIYPENEVDVLNELQRTFAS